MLCIRDILVRVRIRGSVPLPFRSGIGSGSGSGSCFFRQWLIWRQNCLPNTFWRYINISLQKVKKSQYRGKSMFFFLFCLLMKGSGSSQKLRIRFRETQEHTDSDPPTLLTLQHLCRTSMHIFLVSGMDFDCSGFGSGSLLPYDTHLYLTVDPDPHLESWEGKGCTGTLYTV